MMIDPNVARLGFDTTFEMNAFSQPRIRNELELIKNTLLYLLFSKPGQYPSIPWIGLNIRDLLHTHHDNLDVVDLQNRLISQCAAFGVYFENGTIQLLNVLYRNKPALLIHVETTPDDTHVANVQKYLDQRNDNKFLIGITFNELNEMIYNVSLGGDN